jgi:2-polyprenyl-3-methyl-5-hydroxy-6-metoxy-1,4-benzoquinol methylase
VPDLETWANAKAFDFVLCSSFLHHFPNSHVIKLVAELRQIARRALIVLDLERHSLAHCFLPIAKRVFKWSPLTVHDGPVSVAAASRPAELAALVRAAGADSTVVQRHSPWFRISAVVWACSAEEAEHNPARGRMVSFAAD